MIKNSLGKVGIGRKPTITTLLSGSGTYTVPAGINYLRVRMVGGAGASGLSGGRGGSGIIIIEEYYN